MRILVTGDVVGEPGRRLLEEYLPTLRRDLKLDFIIVNGENAAHGHGITERIAQGWFTELGVDVITTGNHAFDVKEIVGYFQKETRLLRPANYPPGTPGNGFVKLHTPSGLETAPSEPPTPSWPRNGPTSCWWTSTPRPPVRPRPWAGI